ncbi:DUF5592 family protein [Alkalicoccobacillus gibsonii]|uniref:DUF5592 family protein n=1 Tax=Alkalicoccobacillus gibsonii TaxID=79881 RepID=UPI00193373F9|nr:DUF5592 family protein [Alkalicoccobacillus gibsonii]MBM0067959.1 hypothetical protein [Alkalicoccobacillus gibsonii]
MSKYIIPNDIKTEIKMYKEIYMFDFWMVVGTVVISWALGRLIEPGFKIPFYLFMVVVIVTLLCRPRSNPKKRMYQAMTYALNRSRQTYQSIDEPRNREEG